MKIPDTDILALFRGSGKCEMCGKQCRQREPSHLWGKGHGGGFTLNIRINLMAMGSTPNFCCQCHNEHHQGKIGVAEMVEKVAKREKETEDDITDVIFALHAVPPRLSESRIERFLLDWPLGETAIILAKKTLVEAKVLGS